MIPILISILGVTAIAGWCCAVWQQHQRHAAERRNAALLATIQELQEANAVLAFANVGLRRVLDNNREREARRTLAPRITLNPHFAFTRSEFVEAATRVLNDHP